MTAEVHEPLRPADISQLEAAYVMHMQECRTCTSEQSCDIARRLEDARNEAGVLPS
jgi:hypothetical protein